MRNLYEHLIAQTSSENGFLGVSEKTLIKLISGITQSNENFVLDYSFIVEATYVNVPTGKGKRKRVTVKTATKSSRVSITIIDNLLINPYPAIIQRKLKKYGPTFAILDIAKNLCGQTR